MPRLIDAARSGGLEVVLLVVFLAWIFVSAWMYPTMTEVKKMDCSLAEFSPDVTFEVKRACRDARSKI